jgi:primosomal protein N' (replication factor Y)
VIFQLLERPTVAHTKPLLAVLDPEPVMTAVQIALAEAMAAETLAPLGAILGLFLPPGLGQQADTLYALVHGVEAVPEQAGQIQKRLLALLKSRGPLRSRQIDRHFRLADWRRSAEWLVKRGLLEKQSVLPEPRVHPKYLRVAQLAVPPDVARAAMPDLGRTEAARGRRAAALGYLARELEEVNVSWVYAESGCNLHDLQELAGRGLITLRENQVWRDPLENMQKRGVAPHPPFELTADQERAWEAIQAGLCQAASGRAFTPILLHGVTGSGKTELYLRATAKTIQRGRQAIVLVPEIALTPQTVRRFLARFPGQVGLIHSRLSEGERYDTWRRARAGLLKVVIGPRSALFAPLPEIGLIVLDECHDGSYYQSEPPFYHTVSTAQTYAQLAGAVCLLGSATPSVVQRWQAQTGKCRYLELPQRIPHGDRQEESPGLPPVSIVDMRAELKAGNRSIFSRALSSALETTLARGEQAILFLNRRGTATYVFCRDCGRALKCPQCDTPLTFHVDATERLVCHHCGYTRGKPGRCPTCGGDNIREYGLGSERVEAEVETLFPGARVLRWDWETTRQKEAHEIILSHFASHRADVLVGTQMLAKGLDLPLVTLVGMVLADVGLNLPDPFAEERVFQVLTQVAGRSGRSARGGQVILQTFTPDHPVAAAVVGHDYANFYQRTLASRRALAYPPFSRLVRLEFRHREAAQAQAQAVKIAEELKSRIEVENRRQTDLIGPVPCFYSRLRGEYRWQVVLRGPDPQSLLRGNLPDGWRVEVDPLSLL